jgi:hypothetical protein
MDMGYGIAIWPCSKSVVKYISRISSYGSRTPTTPSNMKVIHALAVRGFVR